MFRVSNGIVGFINFVTLLLSIPILGGGIWLGTKSSSDCLRFLQWPIIIIGAAILLVSLAGFVGACFRVSLLLWLYLFVMFLLIVVLLVLIIFAFVVTGKGDGHQVSGRAYKEYRLGDYSGWLRRRVQDAGSWDKIRSCVRDAKVCKNLAEKSANENAMEFYQKDLTPIQSGCCKPPTSCGFTYVSATFWNGAPVDPSESDCLAWSNVQDQLCYNCNSCKAGFLANLKRDWRKVSVLNIVIFVLLVVVYIIGCAAFRNIRRMDNDESYGRARMTKYQPSGL